MRRPIPVILTCAVLLVPACGDLFTSAAAVVDGRRIDEDRFARELDFLLADPRFAATLPPGEEGELRRKELARQYLTFLIHQQVVQRYAEDRGIDVPDQEVGALLDQQVAELGGRPAFDRLLRESGASQADVRRLLEQQLLRRDVAESVVSEEVTEERLQQTYEERELEFTQVHVAHILVTSEAEAQRLARQATPRTFADLARRFSEDTATGPNGGDLGVLRGSDLSPTFARAALRIPVGEVGGPVRTEFGFHLIHVLERETVPFDRVREQLLEELRGQVFTSWLVERLGDADIRVNPRYGYFDRSTGAVVERRSTTPSPAPDVQLQP